MSSLFVAVFIDLIILFLGYKVSQEKKSVPARIFFLVAIVLVAWLSTNFLETWIKNEYVAKIFFDLDFVIAPYLLFILFSFLINFPNINSYLNSNFKVFLTSIPAIVISGLYLKGLVVSNVIFGNKGIFFSDGKFFDLYALVILMYITVGLAALLKKYRNSTGIERSQIKYIFIGFATTFILLCIINLFFQNVIPIQYFQLSNYSSILLIFFTTYAMAKYRLFDIKLLTTELFIFVILFLIIFQVLFVNGTFGYVLLLMTFVSSLIFGVLLIKSVKQEIEKEKELEIANAQLRKLDAAKTEFISIASHQLRTPLTVSNGFLSMVNEGSYGKVPKKLQLPMERVNSANKRLLNLVEDLLNISRIESGRMVFEFTNEKIEDVIKELAESFELPAKEKQLELALVLPESALPQVHIDRGKVREAISNLIDNAIKYTQTGGIKVIAQKHGNFVRVIVADTGIGVKKRRREPGV